MIWYSLGIYLHILAAILWIGQAVYWTMVAEPLTRGVPPETGRLLWEINNGLERIGWPCLIVTVLTGIFLVYYQGTTFHEVSSGHLLLTSFGKALGAKLSLVSVMVILQVFVKPGRLILRWLLILVGLTVISLSTLLVRW